MMISRGACRTVLTVIAIAGAVVGGGCQSEERGGVLDPQKDWRKASGEELLRAETGPAPRILPITHFAAAELLEEGGHYVQALQQYRKAIALNHGYAEAYNRAGILWDRLGRYDEADRALAEAISLRPDYALYYNNLGFSYLLQHRYVEAESMFSEALARDCHWALAFTFADGPRSV